MAENKEKFTQEQMDYYNERITIKLMSDIFTYNEKKVWSVVCKKCKKPLMPFEKDVAKEKIDEILKKHECKKNMKLKITYDNGETRYITNNLNNKQLASLTQYITNGYVGTNKNFPFDWQKVEIEK